jgi:hypothetical protein
MHCTWLNIERKSGIICPSIFFDHSALEILGSLGFLSTSFTLTLKESFCAAWCALWLCKQFLFVLLCAAEGKFVSEVIFTSWKVYTCYFDKTALVLSVKNLIFCWYETWLRRSIFENYFWFRWAEVWDIVFNTFDFHRWWANQIGWLFLVVLDFFVFFVIFWTKDYCLLHSLTINLHYT